MRKTQSPMTEMSPPIHTSAKLRLRRRRKLFMPPNRGRPWRVAQRYLRNARPSASRERQLHRLGLGVEAIRVLLFDARADLFSGLEAREDRGRHVAGHALDEDARPARHLFADRRGYERDVDRAVEGITRHGVMQVGPHGDVDEVLAV